MAADSKSSVVAALVGNTFVMIMKFGAWFMTGSGSMFSEGIHTLADVLNQLLLLVGIVRSGKGPTEKYQYGHGQERFVWALVSAVGIFFLGCGVTLYHGIAGLFGDHVPMKSLEWAIGVLTLSLIIEGIVLLIAVKGLLAAADGRPFISYLRKEADPSAVAVLLEDSAACLGVIFAMIAIGLSHWTGHAYWDSVGSITIALLLGGVAVWLTFRNKELLMGRSAPEEATDMIRKAIEGDNTVERIVTLKSKVIDTETYDVLVELEFHGEKLAERLEPRIREAYDKGINDYDAFYDFTKVFADDVVELLGTKVDELEKKVMDAVPQVKHIDVEPD